MRVTDPQAIRALAHPLRLDLIELLSAIGPATAATCARHLGTGQASCSFHLRQLAKYGYVEQAPETGDRRERPWRLTDTRQDIGEQGPAADEMSRVFVEREAVRILDSIASRADEPQRWRDATFLSGATLPVTAEELAAIRDGIEAVLEPYADRIGHEDRIPDTARFVRVFLAGTPLASLDAATAGER